MSSKILNVTGARVITDLEAYLRRGAPDSKAPEVMGLYIQISQITEIGLTTRGECFICTGAGNIFIVDEHMYEQYLDAAFLDKQ